MGGLWELVILGATLTKNIYLVNTRIKQYHCMFIAYCNCAEHNSNTGFLGAGLTSSSGCVYGMACCRGLGHHCVPRLHNGGNFGRVALQLGAIFKHHIHNLSRPTPQRPATSSLLKPWNSTWDNSPDVMENIWSEMHTGKGVLSLLKLFVIFC